MTIFSLLLHSYAEKLLKAEPRLQLFSWYILQLVFFYISLLDNYSLLIILEYLCLRI